MNAAIRGQTEHRPAAVQQRLPCPRHSGACGMSSAPRAAATIRRDHRHQPAAECGVGFNVVLGEHQMGMLTAVNRPPIIPATHRIQARSTAARSTTSRPTSKRAGPHRQQGPSARLRRKCAICGLRAWPRATVGCRIRWPPTTTTALPAEPRRPPTARVKRMQARDIDGQRRAGIGPRFRCPSPTQNQFGPMLPRRSTPNLSVPPSATAPPTPVFLGEVVPRHPVGVGRRQRAQGHVGQRRLLQHRAHAGATHARRRSVPPSTEYGRSPSPDVTDTRQRSVDTAQHVSDADVGGRSGEFGSRHRARWLRHQPIGPQVRKKCRRELRRNALGFCPFVGLDQIPGGTEANCVIARTVYSAFADIRMPRILPSRQRETAR